MTNWYAAPGARGWTSTAPTGAARAFHRALPDYAPTPLVDLPALAAELGVARVMVKDESSRLGLPAFKVLGASWACAQVVGDRTGLRLVTATDGNHGRAVARMAARLGAASTVFVPAVMSEAAAAVISSEGADVVRTDADYDETVRRAAEFAAGADSRRLVQDTAWPGYEQVPAWIVEGYDTLLDEVDAALGRAPDLVVVPVGVGSRAQAVVVHYRQPGTGRASVLSVEPDTAACVLASLAAGQSSTVGTAGTIMAGLNCGTPSSAAWPVLRDGCDAAVCVSDEAAAQAVTDLGRLGVSSGPCGAASLAGARAALGRPERRREIGVDEHSVVALLSTEAGPQPVTRPGSPAGRRG
jgi:diaminopropionate ammonia-lyase